MSLILNIETSGKTCSVALAERGNLLSCIESHPDNYIHSEKLNVFIEQLFSDSNQKIKDLSAVCVSKGPGSFTGLRIGTSCAKGLCYALSIPLLAVDALTVMMHNYSFQERPKAHKYIPMIDARRMEVYMALFNEKFEMDSSIVAEVIDANSFDNDTASVVLFGDGADKLESLVFPKQIKIISGFKTSAKAMCTLSYKKFQKSEFEDLAYFEPFYLKDFKVG